MNDNITFVLAGILATVVLLSPIGCQVHRDAIRTEALSKSADPIALSCALDSLDSNGNSKALCTLKASAK